MTTTGSLVTSTATGGSGDVVLQVRDLVKTFTLHAIGGTRVAALRGVSLDVRAGEHVALAGPSGAGKSSLLRCVHRLYLPDSGTISLRRDGDHPRESGTGESGTGESGTGESGTGESGMVELTALSDRAMARLRGRELGWVPQFLSALPRTGPLALVAATARRRGLDAEAAEQAAAESLRRLGLAERLWPVDCSLLSGGERQRVNLAAGTVSPPRLLLLDEPVSALDPVNRVRAMQLIEDLNDRADVTVLAIYHDVELIQRLADRVVVVEDGLLAADGTPAEVLSAHPGRLTDHDDRRSRAEPATLEETR